MGVLSDTISKPISGTLSASISKAISGGASLFSIDTVVVFGASMMEQSFSDEEDAANKWFNENILLTVHERATSGDTTTQMLTRLPAIISEFQANAENTLFAIHWGGNDISQSGPYPGGAATMEANMRSMLDDIKAAGFKIMMSDITYRIPPASNPSMPYNDAFMYQLQSEYNDIDWFLYQLTFDNQANIEPDGIHPDPVLEDLIRQEAASSSKDFIVKSIPTNATEVTTLVVEFGNNTLMESDSTSNRIDTNTTINDLRNADYGLLSGSSLTLSGATSINSVGRGNTADPGNTTVSLFNDECLKDSMFTNGTTMNIDLSGLPLNDADTYTVGITASRADTSGTKVSDYLVDGITKTLNSELDPPGQVFFNGVTGLELKTNGVKIDISAGSSFAYISMLELVKE